MEIYSGLECLGAAPGKSAAWIEEDGKGHGGASTRELAAAILHKRGEEKTDDGIANLVNYLNKAARENAGIRKDYVASNRQAGRVWVIKNVIELVD
jgi:hypothetical protein